MKTSSPVAVAVVSAFITSALIGSTTDPVISHRIVSVTTASTISASGSEAAIEDCWSSNSAAGPPTSTGTGAAVARTRSIVRCAPLAIGSPAPASTSSHVPLPRYAGGCTAVTPGIERRRVP